MKKVNNVLGIDWGDKYIGCAYVNDPSMQGASNVVMPIGYIMNDGLLFFNIGDILQRYNIKKLVIGYPKENEDLQAKIDKFISQVGMIDGDIDIERVDEEYSSVEAESVTGNHGKSAEKDIIAAMKILERWLGN